MARRKLLHALDQSERTRNVVESEIILERGEVDVPRNFGVDKERFEFGSEVKFAARPASVKGLDADTVAHKHEPALILDPKGSGKHSAQTAETTGVPLEKGAEEDFGVAVRDEAVTNRFEFAAKVTVIVDFAIEDEDGIAVFGD